MRLAGQLVGQYEAVMLPRSSASVILMMRLIIADPCTPRSSVRRATHAVVWLPVRVNNVAPCN